MKGILKVIGILLLIIVAFVLIAGIFVKKNYHLERSIAINAPKEKVWPYVGTLSGMEKWSPWMDIDPNVKTSVSGTDGTVGATYSWEGNKDVGSGTQTITKVQAPDRMDTRIHFIKPFDSQADEFAQIADSAGATKATWSLDINYKYPMNVMLLFINMDNVMMPMYDKGLQKLKALSEAN